MLRPPIAATAVFIALAGSLSGQAPAPRIHRLEATPTTVAYGYYWAEAKPVLRIASGDISGRRVGPRQVVALLADDWCKG